MFSIIKRVLTLIPLLLSQVVHGSPLKADESILFFPTSARLLSNGECEIPIHSWVYEPETDSLIRKAGIKLIGELMENFDISEEQTESDLFRQRLAWFLVDNERNKKITISLNDTQHTLNKTSANGHSHTQITIPCINGSINKTTDETWTTFTANTHKNDKRSFQGQIQLIPSTGVSVISDIDDTIKISEVLDKKALMRHTFAEPFHVTEGMPEYYQQLKDKGAYFHYVSSSPWQLYSSLNKFIHENYPKGSISLRDFRVTDSSLIDFLTSSKDYKLDTIRGIIKRYPKHQFILIGDSGENDPEIYAKIAEEFPENIKAVLIRNVPESNMSDERFKDIKKETMEHFQIFKKPDEIKLLSQ